MELIRGTHKPLTEVEEAFARAKLMIIKQEIHYELPGVIYDPDFNHYMGDHPEFVNRQALCMGWRANMRVVKPKRYGRCVE